LYNAMFPCQGIMYGLKNCKSLNITTSRASVTTARCPQVADGGYGLQI